MKLLHIVATPRQSASNTLRVSSALIAGLQARYADLSVETINLFQQDLPAVAGNNIDTKYTLILGQPIDKNHAESWQQIEALIKHFQAADLYVISAPMWNFGIPYALKYYIDAVVQPGYLYKYNEVGQPVPLTLGKKMVCVTSRGGDYSEASPFHVYDFQEPYLRAIFGFIGITDMEFINAQPMDINRELREIAVASAIEKAAALVATKEWVDNAQPCRAGKLGRVEAPADLMNQLSYAGGAHSSTFGGPNGDYPSEFSLAMGRRTINSQPWPFPALLASTCPPWAVTMAFTIASPSPVPPVSRLRVRSPR